MSVKESLLEAIYSAENMYHRLVVIVGEQGAGKTKLLQEASRDMNKPLINVNLELSKRLLELTGTSRKMKVGEILSDILDATASDIIFLDNAELLFDANLNQDPLRLFQILSRKKTVIVSWNGRLENNQLIYAEPEHPEFRKEKLSGEIVFELPKKKEFGN